jgi:flavorubredoxin
MSDELTGEYLESFRYYFDVILKPFSKFMLKAIEKIRPLDINFICPGHGPVLGSARNTIINLTEKYSRQYLEASRSRSRKRVLITYVSAYGFTEMAAGIIASGIREAGNVEVDVVDIECIDPVELDALITSSDGIIAGSPTINQNTLLPVYKLFALVNPIRDKGKLAGSFGSYGWSGEAPRIILDTFKNLKLEVFGEPVPFRFLPSVTEEKSLKEYGMKFAAGLSVNETGKE